MGQLSMTHYQPQPIVLSCYAFKLYILRSGCQKSRVQSQRLALTLDS
jgi:hypothetical protein